MSRICTWLIGLLGRDNKGKAITNATTRLNYGKRFHFKKTYKSKDDLQNLAYNSLFEMLEGV